MDKTLRAKLAAIAEDCQHSDPSVSVILHTVCAAGNDGSMSELHRIVLEFARERRAEVIKLIAMGNPT